LERDASVPNDRLYRLTAAGRLQALGGRDPEERWARGWDGQWRIVLFDVPSSQNAQRERLRRYLRERNFGCLQNSVWISPDPLAEQRETLAGGKVSVKSLVMLESRTIGGESDAEIAAAAWDFDEVNRRYARHLKVLDERPLSGLRTESGTKAFHRWVATEREAWQDAMTRDPLLPKRLLPADYAGQRSWRRRVEVLQQAVRHLRVAGVE